MSGDSLIPFEYSGRELGAIVIDGEPWFIARDVAEILDLSSTPGAVRLLDEDEKGVHIVHTPGGDQQMSIVNEAGLYSLIFRSRKTEAKAFKRWVTHEVLPAIRKTGNYQLAERFQIPQTFAEALELAATQTRALEASQAKVLELHPKAASWDTLADTGADYACRDAAYILNRDPGISTGQNRLLQILRDWRLIDRNGKPYANHSAHVTLRPQFRTDPGSGERVPARPQVRVTVAGLSYLHKRLGGVEPLDLNSEVAS